MKYSDILGHVAQRGGIGGRQVDAAVKCTLQAVAEQGDPKQVADLLEQLPKELKQSIRPAAAPQYRSLPEFVGRVAELTGMSTEDAQDAARAVIGVIAEEINYDQIEDLFGRMPSEYLDLIPTRTERITTEEFLERVRQRAGLGSSDEAHATVRATLAALAERISGGQAQDLGLYLPGPIRKYLAGGGEQATALDKDAFFDRIAHIERTDRATATQHAAAVFTTLVDAVPRQEIQDMLDQLPSGVRHLVGEPARHR